MWHSSISITRTLTALIIVSLGFVPSSHREVWSPPAGNTLRIAAFYALPRGPYNAGHRGIDLEAEHGQIIRAPVTGVVAFVGDVVDRPVLSIRVAERSNIVLSLEPVRSDLKAGDEIRRGQAIGTLASGGHCQSCLHLGVRVNNEYVNPLRFFSPRPILVPW